MQPWNSDWFPLPGPAVFDLNHQGVTVVSRSVSDLDLFVVGNDSHVWSTYWHGASGWSANWFPLPGQAVFDLQHQRVAAVSRAPGNLDLFLVGNDGHIWSTYWNDTAGWSTDWFPLPGTAVFDLTTQHVTVVSRTADNLDLFIVGNDSHVWSTSWSSTAGWNSDWAPLPGQAVFDLATQRVAAVSRAAGNLDLFIIGNDGHVWSTFWNSSAGWSSDWFPLPGQAVFDLTTQQVTVVSRAWGNLDLFLVGNDSHVWSTYWNSSSGWSSDWFPLPGKAVFDLTTQHVAAVSRTSDNLDLFIVGNESHVWLTSWTSNSGWNSDWAPLPGQAVFNFATQWVAGVSRSPANLDLFIIGNDGHIWSTYWPNILAVIYNGNGATGGSVPVDSNTYSPGETVNVQGNANDLVLAGAIWAYWNTAADGSGTTYGWPVSTTFVMGSEPVTLYAQWFVTTGLTNGGNTAHYQFSYDRALASGLAPVEPGRTNALIQVAESDYQIMSNWFGGDITPGGLPISTRVAALAGGANATGAITLKPGRDASVEMLRYLIVAEMTELFMDAQGKGWFAPDGSNEQSAGEGLSRFLAQQFLVVTGLSVAEPGFGISNNWLNSSLPLSNSNSTQLGPQLPNIAVNVDANATSILTDSDPSMPFASTFVVLVDSEQMLVSSTNATSKNMTVERGYNGTTAASHASNAPVTFVYGPRTDYVNVTLERDHSSGAAPGCAMLFLYYLHVQLGYGINAIIGAASNGNGVLRNVYKQLSGSDLDPFPAFNALLASAFPPSDVSSIPGANPDNPFPLSLPK